MNTPPAPASPAAPRRSKAVYATQALVMLFALSACVVLAVMLGSKTSARFDLTATREHELAPETLAIINALPGPATIVVAANQSDTDPRLLQQTDDLLSTFRHRSHDRVTGRFINTNSPDGAAQYADLLASLAKEDAPAIDAQKTVINLQAAAAEQSAGDLRALADALGSIRDAAATGPGGRQARDLWDQWAGYLRVLADELAKSAADSRAILARTIAPLPVPKTDDALRLIRVQAEASSARLSVLANLLDTLAKDDKGLEAVRAAAQRLAPTLTPIRDHLGRMLAELERQTSPRILRIARAIQGNRAVLVIGPPVANSQEASERPTVTAIDSASFLPLAAPSAGPVIDMRTKQEQLLAGALSSFIPGPRPVVVLVHAAKQRIGPGYAEFSQLTAALSLRGIDIMEWPIMVDAEPPVIPPARDGSRRPVVWCVIPLEPRNQDLALRMGRVADALHRLIVAGDNILTSVYPSSLPGSGASDPMVAPFAELGLKVDSGRPLLQEDRQPGRVIYTSQYLLDPGTDHPIARAIAGSRLRLLWPLPMHIAANLPPGVHIEPVIKEPPRDNLWAESEWLGLRQAEATRQPMDKLPAKDSPQDDAGGPNDWVLAAAIDRANSAADTGHQRIVVVGSSEWYIDPITRPALTEDGRVIDDAPANVELFRAAVAWLAGQEQTIQRAASTGIGQRIEHLSDASRGRLGIVLVAVIPGLTLVLGLLWRLWRG